MKPTIKFRCRNSGCNGINSKVVSNGVVKINIDDTSIVDYLRKGHDVELCSIKTKKPMIHLYQMLKSDGTPYICAQTMNPFRSSIASCNISVRYAGKDYEGKEAAETIAKAHAELKQQHPRICVTADRVVECPKCGTEFRVGKFLTNKKG